MTIQPRQTMLILSWDESDTEGQALYKTLKGLLHERRVAFAEV